MTDKRPPHQNPAASKPDAADDEVVEQAIIPIVEERVAVGKIVEEGRTVTVSSNSVEENVPINETLESSKVEVRRVPKNEPLDSAAETREENGVTIVPVMEERLVVTKQLVLVEEIHLVRTNSTRDVEQMATIRKTVVDIDTDDEPKR